MENLNRLSGSNPECYFNYPPGSNPGTGIFFFFPQNDSLISIPGMEEWQQPILPEQDAKVKLLLVLFLRGALFVPPTKSEHSQLMTVTLFGVSRTAGCATSKSFWYRTWRLFTSYNIYFFKDKILLLEKSHVGFSLKYYYYTSILLQCLNFCLCDVVVVTIW